MKVQLTCALALLVAAPMASFAAERDGDASPPVKVAYRDLDLGRRDDAAQLLRRLDSAATEACGGWVSNNPIDLEIARTSDCHAQAMKQAVERVNAPVVSALYARSLTLAARAD